MGMNPIAENHVIKTNEDALKLYTKKNITNIIDLRNGKELISFFNKSTELDEDNSDIKNISVVESAAVTAYARIHMSTHI